MEVPGMTKFPEARATVPHRWRCLTWVLTGLVCAAVAPPPALEAQAMVQRVDPCTAQLHGHGDGMEDDSVARAIVAAARLLDCQADYETVSCQLGNAFAPSIDLGEDCTSHWQVCAWHNVAGLAAAGRRLGLRFAPLPLPVGGPADTLPEARAELRRGCARVVAAAMDRGAVVLTPGGWDPGLNPPGQHGFVHWGMMGIITRADTATGDLLGAHPNGFTDNPLHCPEVVWAVTVAPPPASAVQADREMLRQAVDRIRGLGAFAATPRAVYGQAAMEAWIRQMRTVPGFCATCFGQLGPRTGDAPNNARRLLASAGIAARQLRHLAAEQPRAAADLSSAADRYDRIAALLAPAVSGPAGGRYTDFAGDLARQQQHADAVLVPVAQELDAVASDLEQALIAMVVQRDGAAVQVLGTPGAAGDGNGYGRGLEAMLAHQGAPVSYERLMAWSGLAFITQADSGHRWEGQVDVGWWPLDPWGLVSRLAFLAQAVGYELRPAGMVDSPPAVAAAAGSDPANWYQSQVQPELEQALAAGQPVLALSDFGQVLTGCDRSPQGVPVLGHCARAATPTPTRPPWWPAGIVVLGRRLPALTQRDADAAALRQAVALIRDQAGSYDTPWIGRRATGQRALAAWASLLRQESEPVQDRHHANMRGRLLDQRRAALVYLEELAASQPEPVAGPLRRAAACYAQSLDLLSAMDPTGLEQSQARRRALASQVERLAETESQAADWLAQSVPGLAVRHDGDRTWIEVPGFTSGQYASSVHGAQARILEALGETLTYDDLVCYSGFAFRVSVHRDFCPSAGHPCCGYVCREGSERALPWQTRVFTAPGPGATASDTAAFQAETRAAIKASIDAGVPVHYGSEEDGLIVGYGNDGRRWLCVHPYHANGAQTFWFDEAGGFAGGNWPWAVEVWTGPRQAHGRPGRRELTLAALRQAVTMWNTERVEDYYCGDAAYGHWLAWLRGIEAGTVADPAGGRHGSGWCYDVLVQNRQVAARWLTAAAPRFAGPAHDELLAAAGLYRQLAADCTAGLSCPWDLSPAQGWSSSHRQDQIRRLEAARSYDGAAVAALGRALAAIEAHPEP
jgi:hypothetical protein